MAIFSNDVSDKVLRVLQSANRLDYNKLTAARAEGTGASADVLERMLRSGDIDEELVHTVLSRAYALRRCSLEAKEIDVRALPLIPRDCSLILDLPPTVFGGRVSGPAHSAELRARLSPVSRTVRAICTGPSAGSSAVGWLGCWCCRMSKGTTGCAMPRRGTSLRGAFAPFFVKANISHSQCLSAGATHRDEPNFGAPPAAAEEMEQVEMGEAAGEAAAGEQQLQPEEAASVEEPTGHAQRRPRRRTRWMRVCVLFVPIRRWT